MPSIKYDETEILNTTFIPRYVKHESAPERELTLLDLAREDGSILVAEKYGRKSITLIGYLVGSSKSDLETKIDSFKELFSRKEKNLDVDWEDGTRRYVATCVRHNFDRDHFHLLFVPWTAEFIVISGIGEDTSETTLVNGQSFSIASAYTKSVTFAGSAKSRPRITVTFQSYVPAPFGISIKNPATGETLIYNRSGGLLDIKVFELDCRKKTVKYDGEEVPFLGVFPTFIVGSNNIIIQLGELLDQYFYVDDTPSISRIIYGNAWAAQSFSVPYTDNTYRVIRLFLDKNGTPPNDLVVEIQTDNDGKPSGTAVTNGTFAIPEAGVGIGGWIKATSANPFTLEANTRYWIVCKTTDGDISNNYGWHYERGIEATYKRGNYSVTPDAGVNWTAHFDKDFLFKLYYGGQMSTGDATLNVYYYKRYL